MKNLDINRLITSSKITAEALNVNRFILKGLMEEVVQGKTQTDRVYALSFLLRYLTEEQNKTRAS